LATFSFETITSAQARAFDGQVDTLAFTDPTTSGATLRVTFSPETANTTTTLTVLDVADNHQVLFGAGLENLHAVLPDGSMLVVGGGGGGELTGGPGNDGIFGVAGAETLNGGAGDDVVQGGGGADVLEGGAGSNLFLFNPGDSPPTLSLMDRIIDWSPADRLGFVFANSQVAPDANASNYVETTAANFSAAATTAQTLIAGGVVEYVSVQVGGDVVVFADGGFHSTPQEAVMLQGRTLADIDASNIVSGVTAPMLSLPLNPPTSSPPSVLPALPVFPTIPPSSPTSPLIVTPETFPSPLPAATSGVTVVLTSDVDLTQVAKALTTSFPSVSPTEISVVSPAGAISLNGYGFALDGDDNLTGGTVTGLDVNLPDGALGRIVGLSVPIASVVDAAEQGTAPLFSESLYGGDDSIYISSASGSIHGYAGNDTIESGIDPVALFGDTGDDYLIVGPSSQLIGGPGADTMTAPAGSDVFVFNAGDGNPAAAAGNSHLELLDRIEDWSSSDFLQFVGGAVPTSANFAEVTAGSFSDALTDAQANLAQGIEYTVAQVGNLYVFVVDLRTGNAVVLDDRTLANISMSNVGPDPAELSTSSPPASGGGQILVAALGGDTIQAPETNDTITSSSSASNYLRGNGGDDSIQGGAGFDDINGNKGNDTIDGGSGGGDWLVGGQANDFITAHHSQNLLYGNLGNDTLHGGDGGDVIRGGQGDDVIVGGSGNDFISGDRGNDTESGGAGADIFHTSQDAGIDRVLDFSTAQGDRVELDPGTTYTVSQVGADTVINMGPSADGSPNEIILVGVQMSSLAGAWIFGA
jgi:Ca2+-binding RTX toxin-like protein